LIYYFAFPVVLCASPAFFRPTSKNIGTEIRTKVPEAFWKHRPGELKELFEKIA